MNNTTLLETPLHELADNHDSELLRDMLFDRIDTAIRQHSSGTIDRSLIAETVFQSLPMTEIFESDTRDQCLAVLELFADIRLRERFDSDPFKMLALHLFAERRARLKAA